MSAQTLGAPTVTRTVARGTDSDRLRRSGKAWLFIAPFGLFYLAFLLGPSLYMFVASFFDTSIVKTGLGNFIGLENYTTLLSSSDFWASMWHTLQFTLYTVPPLVVLSFVFAVLANRMQRGQVFWRMAFFTPFILPSAAISLIWVFIFTADTGLWATVQKWFGSDAPTPVLATPSLAMVGIAVATVWWTIGFNFILYLAGLQDIPRELYEAAAIDGATPWQQIRHLTIPLLSRTTTLVLLLQIIASLKIFDQVYLMTNGGPGTSTETALVFITKTGFTDYRIGAAAAASFLLFVVIVVIALVRQIVERAQQKGA
ncbi:carbohydrate ABC transporter permease [Kineococcus aurantiacus]|uniref:Multiple sugar transport system permease protein n=1 Tax=Kineococcus aurantiacus TaxID=37633 RepID=A0A7Y9DND4_9ACTN|nr:sugar ABC transporter permease [Kineococcus aurantiacus]NYD23790.1 multiple sugar transport system permease protein [Kineococcus aurantiacus]